MATLTMAERLAVSAARRCGWCGKRFMATAQLRHHQANAARLCKPKGVTA